MNVNQAKYLIQIFSLCYTFAMFLWAMAIWWVAYFSGVAAALVTINQFGEMIPEFYIWFVLIPIVVYGWYLNFKVIFYGRSDV